MNLDLLLRLLAAHFFSDFIFQPNDWVKERAVRKINSKYLYFHTLIILVLTFFAAWNFSLLWAVLFITVTHYLIDLGKSYIKKDTPVIFIVDQSLHILIICVCWLIYTSNYSRFTNDLNFLFNDAEFWLYVIAYLMVTMPASVFINKFTSKWSNDIDEQSENLKNAGKWIGIIERILILTFIILNQFEAIGFLIAAKSVFRFGELKESEKQKRVEYILIGTLVSFSVAVITGIILNVVRSFLT
jgi:hypothetical protein